MAASSKYSPEEPKWEVTEGLTEEEVWKDYLQEARNWAWSQEHSEFVFVTDTHQRNNLMTGRSANQINRSQRIAWNHLFKTFKHHPKGKPVLDSVAVGVGNYAIDAVLSLQKVFVPITSQLALDLDEQLTRAAVFDGKQRVAQITAKMRNLINRMTSLGSPPNMSMVLARFEETFISYAAKQPEGSIEKTWATWIYNIKMTAPGRVLTLDILDLNAPDQERMIEKHTTRKVPDLATFKAVDSRLADARRHARFNALNSFSPRRGRSTTPEPRERSRSGSPWRERSGNDGGRRDRYGRRRSYSPRRDRSLEGKEGSMGRYRSKRFSPESRGGDVTCFDCGEKGHISPKCPHREKHRDKIKQYLRELIDRDKAHAAANHADDARSRSQTRSESKKRRGSSRERSRSRSRSLTPANDLVKVSFHEYMQGKRPRVGSGPINCAAVRLLLLSNLPKRPNQTAYDLHATRDSLFRRDDEQVHWMIVDSGCNRHYLCRLDFLFRVADINVPIRGIGDNVVQATKEGIFMGYFRYSQPLHNTVSRWGSFTSFGLYIANSAVSLFSISQATMAGENTIVHEGTPDSGKHGMYTKNGGFVPFHFCFETQLWWIPILHRPHETSVCALAQANAHIYDDAADQNVLALTGIGNAWKHAGAQS
jgi:hypothetical protein